MKKYLLERFPTLWNTQLVWMLPLALIAHVLCFILGYNHLTITNFDWEWYGADVYLDNNAGILLLLFIPTVLLLLVWSLHLVRHNAFKVFYPLSRWQLIGQFLSYFVIITASITLVFSFFFGAKTKMDSYCENSFFSSALVEYNKNEAYQESIYNNDDTRISEAITETIEEPIESFLITVKSFYYSLERDLYDYGLLALYFALAAASLLLCFRLTSLRIGIITVLSAAVLMLFFILIKQVFSPYIITTLYSIRSLFIIAFLGYVFALISLVFFMRKMSKLVAGVLMNLLLLLAPFMLFYILLEITVLIIEPILLSYFNNYNSITANEQKYIFLDWLLNAWYIFVRVSGLVLIIPFLALYTKVIFKWKAMPE